MDSETDWVDSETEWVDLETEWVDSETRFGNSIDFLTGFGNLSHEVSTTRVLVMSRKSVYLGS